MGVTIPGTGVVVGLPPKPWPNGYINPLADTVQPAPTGTYPRPPWGPPGTTYLWTLGQLVDRCIQLRTDGLLHSRSEVDQLLRGVLELLFPAQAGESVALESLDRSDPIFLLPGTTEVPAMSFQYVSAQIHGKLGTFEEVSHTLALVHSGTDAAPDTLDEATLAGIGGGVVQAWTAFIQAANSTASPFSSSLVYDRVTVAAKTVAGPAPKTGSRKGLVRNDGASVEVPFPTGVTGSLNSQLPYQCALVLTLGTDKKGASFRGRVFLGGLANSMSPGPDGTLQAAAVAPIGAAFGTHVVEALSHGAWHVNIWSARLAAGREVQNVKIGTVIDTMRSRRKSLPENPAVVWGTP